MNNVKLYILITIVITLCLQLACSSTDTTELRPQLSRTETISTTIDQADSLYRQREDISKLREAADLLARLRNPGQRNFDVEWRFAKINYFLGKYLADKKEADSAFEKGRDAGKIASEM